MPLLVFDLGIDFPDFLSHAHFCKIRREVVTQRERSRKLREI